MPSDLLKDIQIVNGPLKERAESVINCLKEQTLSVVTAESCTAGLLSALLSKAKGAGEVLQGGFVCYSKEHKTIALGLSAELLRAKTAVCAEVAGQMAKGALERSKADFALSVTGVLGPEPDEDGKPVGLVYVARQRRAGDLIIVRHDFGKLSHQELCAKTLHAALDLMHI